MSTAYSNARGVCHWAIVGTQYHLLPSMTPQDTATYSTYSYGPQRQEISEVPTDVLAPGEAASKAAKQAAALQSAMISMWRGDVSQALATVVAADALTADFVSIAASAGHQAWLGASRLYAQKLQQRGEFALLYAVATQGVLATASFHLLSLNAFGAWTGPA